MCPTHSKTGLLVVKTQLSLCLIISTPPSVYPKDLEGSGLAASD